MATMQKTEEKKTVFTVKDYHSTKNGEKHAVLPENRQPKKSTKKPAEKKED